MALLAVVEKTFGSEHPYVAMISNNVAMLDQAEGMYAKAEPLFQRALTIREKAFGPDHPDVATSLNNLALLYQAEGAYTIGLSHLAEDGFGEGIGTAGAFSFAADGNIGAGAFADDGDAAG